MHEVNNPLEAIINMVYLAKMSAEDPASVRKYLGMAEEQLGILAQVTREALTFHRQQAEAKPFDLVKIAESALKLHAEKCTRHQVTIKRIFAGPAVAVVHGSEILQVISNLILNAVEVLTDQDGEICVRVRSSANGVTLVVSDNGPGIPERFAQKLFEPYLTSKQSGTGLGLWISRRIVEKHRGTLRFRTSRTPGSSGTTFRVSLPNVSAA